MAHVNDNSVYKDTIRLTTKLQNVTKTIFDIRNDHRNLLRQLKILLNVGRYPAIRKVRAPSNFLV